MNQMGFVKIVSLLICLLHLTLTERPKQTENDCEFELLPPDIITSLEKASNRILASPQPKDYSVDIGNVNNAVQKLNEAFFTTDEDGQPVALSEQIVEYQERFGNMLSSVLNSNIDITNALADMRSNGSGVSLALTEAIQSQQVNTKMLSNITTLLQAMSSATESNYVAIDHKLRQRDQGASSCAVHDKTIQLQNKTYKMVEHLFQQSQTQSHLQQTISRLHKTLKQTERSLKKLKAKRSYSKSVARPTDCNDIYASGMRASGKYKIYPHSCACSRPVDVWCDMKSSGGGWTVLLTREKQDKPVNFTRSWTDYKTGFGDASGEFWIGNDNLHVMTSTRRYTLRIEMTNRSGKKRWGRWQEFYIGPESENYELSVAKFSQLSTIGKDVLRKHNKEQFSTYDKDNDASYGMNCAEKYTGGWWYGRCFDIHPTGIIGASDKRRSVSTAHFYLGRKSLIPLKKMSIKIKPSLCASQTKFEAQGHTGCHNEVYP